MFSSASTRSLIALLATLAFSMISLVVADRDRHRTETHEDASNLACCLIVLAIVIHVVIIASIVGCVIACVKCCVVNKPERQVVYVPQQFHAPPMYQQQQPLAPQKVPMYQQQQPQAPQHQPLASPQQV